MSRAEAVSSEARPSPGDPSVGTLVLGRYRIVKALAEGGMGIVYLGRTEGAEGFSRPVVIKRALPRLRGAGDADQMFVREARILSHLQHPGIVGVVDFGEESNAYIMVLEYVHGYDASLWLQYLETIGRRVPRDVALQIAIRVLEALHYAHTVKRADGSGLEIVHRDISPANILLDTEGRVRLLDFGIARISRDAGEYRTQETTFKGKLGYAHPSLIGRGEPSPQTDTYSTAVVLFHLLTGANPFRGAGPADTLYLVTHAPLPKLRDHDPAAPEALEAVLQRGMARDLKDGFGTALEMAEALRGLRRESDADVLATMAQLFSEDFSGDLPESLGVQPLNQREAAWRTGGVAKQSGPLRSSLPPALESREQATIVERPRLEEESDALERAARSARVVPPELPTRRSSTTTTTTIIIGGLVAVVVLAVGVISWLRPVGDSQRYVVVNADGSKPMEIGNTARPPPEPTTQAEATSAAGAAPSASSQPPITPTTGTLEPSQGAPKKNSPPSGSGAQKPDPRVLTKKFSQHQGRVQKCFAADLEVARQYPSTQIVFSVGENGAVRSAELVPAALSGTSVGQCLLRVAKSARFGALSEPVTFRIPVHSQVK